MSCSGLSACCCPARATVQSQQALRLCRSLLRAPSPRWSLPQPTCLICCSLNRWLCSHSTHSRQAKAYAQQTRTLYSISTSGCNLPCAKSCVVGCCCHRLLSQAAVVTQSCASITAASPGCATQLGLHVHHQLLHAAPYPDQVRIWQVQPCGVQCVCIGLETTNVLDTLSMANRHTFQLHFKCNPDVCCCVMPPHGSSVLNFCSH